MHMKFWQVKLWQINCRLHRRKKFSGENFEESLEFVKHFHHQTFCAIIVYMLRYHQNGVCHRLRGNNEIGVHVIHMEQGLAKV